MRLHQVFNTIIISGLIFLTSACSNGTTTGTNNTPITLPSGQVGLAGFQTLSADSDEVDDRVSANMYLTVTENHNYKNFLISLPAAGEFNYGNGSFIVESPIWTGSTTGACLRASYKGIRRDLDDNNPLTTYKQEVGTLEFTNCNLNTSDLMSATLVMTNSNSSKFKYILAGFAFPSYNFLAVDANQALYTQTTAPVLLVRGLTSFKNQGDLIPLEFLSDIPFANKDTLSKLITQLQQQPQEALFTSPISGQSNIFGTLSGNISFNLITNLENFTTQFEDLNATINLESFPTPADGGLSYLRSKPTVSSESATISATGEGGGAFNNIFNPNGQVNANYTITLGIDTKEQTSAVTKQNTNLTLLSMYASMMPNYKESFAINYAGYTESSGKLFIFNPSDKAHLVLDMITPYPNFCTFYTVTIKLGAGLSVTDSDIIPQNSDIKCSISTNNSVVCQFFQNANGRGTKVDMYLSQIVHQEGFTYTVNMTSAQQATLVNSQTRVRFVTPDNPTQGKTFAYIAAPRATSPGTTSLDICNVQTNTLIMESCVIAAGFESEEHVSTISVDTTNKRAYIAIKPDSSAGTVGEISSCAINADTGALSNCSSVSLAREIYSATLDSLTNPTKLYVNVKRAGLSYGGIYVCPITAATGAIGTCVNEDSLGRISRENSYTAYGNNLYFLEGTNSNHVGVFKTLWSNNTFTNTEAFTNITTDLNRFYTMTNNAGIIYSTGVQNDKVYIYNANTSQFISSAGVSIKNAGNVGDIVENISYLFYQNGRVFISAQSYINAPELTILYCNIANNNIVRSSCTMILDVATLTGETNYPVQGIGFYNLPAASPTPPAPSEPKMIFVSNSHYDGNLGGFSGANAKCNADTNKPPGGGTYKALLDGNDATVTGVSYTRSNGTTRIAVATGGNLVGFNTLESSVIPAYNGGVWTGGAGNNCSDWTSSVASSIKGDYGFPNAVDKNWYFYYNTNNNQSQPAECNTTQKLYCVQQ